MVDQAGEDDVCSLEIAGPGFINFRIKPEFYASRLLAMLADERLGVEQVQNPKTIVIDFSAPNVAKPMHVGHIRSTIIGDALSRVARFVGPQGHYGQPHRRLGNPVRHDLVGLEKHSG